MKTIQAGSLTITRRFEIDTGHRLLKHESKCRNLHGHRYVFEVEIEAAARGSELELDDVGRVLDFAEIKSAFEDVLERYDHAVVLQLGDPFIGLVRSEGLRLVTMAEPPTVENLVVLVAGEMTERLPRSVVLRHVRCFETPNCWADWTPKLEVSEFE